MTSRLPSRLREFEKWLNATLAEADTIVPDLLALPAPLLLREMRLRPSLRTPGVLRRLLTVARDSVERFPSRAHEIACIVLRCARSMDVPAEFAFVSATVQGEAWREYATALREIGRPAKAEHALRHARRFFEDAPGSSWYLATVDLIEAPLLHDRGLHDDALQMVRQAAHRFGSARDHGRFLEARMIESWMSWAAGDREGAVAVWTATAKAARERGDASLMARVAAKMGVFELRYGSAGEASRLLAAALELFDDQDVSEDAIRARWNLAEAAAAQGRLHEAISEYHIVRAQLLERGSLLHAAIAAVEVLDLHLVAEREDQLPSLTTTFVHVFRDAGLPVNAMEAFAYLRGRAEAGALSQGDVVLARSFFEDLPQKPNARFHA